MEQTHKLVRCASTHKNIRTDEVLGCPESGMQPTVGKSFHFIGPPLEISVGIRLIATSCIKEVRQLEPGVTEFDTANSTYRLERLNTQ